MGSCKLRRVLFGPERERYREKETERDRERQRLKESKGVINGSSWLFIRDRSYPRKQWAIANCPDF